MVLTLEEKKIKKKILDELVLEPAGVLEVRNGSDYVMDEIGKGPNYGIFANHVNVDFRAKKVTIEYYSANGFKPEKMEKSTSVRRYIGGIKLGPQEYKVEYLEVPKPKILTGSELTEYQAKFRQKK